MEATSKVESCRGQVQLRLITNLCRDVAQPYRSSYSSFNLDSTACDGMMHNVGRHLSRSIVQHSEFWNAFRAILPGPKGPGESGRQRIGLVDPRIF